jgi:hypothetical protein
MRRKRGSAGRQGRHFLVLRFAVTSAILGTLFGAIVASWLSGFIRTTDVNHAKDTAAYSM